MLRTNGVDGFGNEHLKVRFEVKSWRQPELAQGPFGVRSRLRATSSAVTSSDCSMVRPSGLAVFRLTTTQTWWTPAQACRRWGVQAIDQRPLPRNWGRRALGSNLSTTSSIALGQRHICFAKCVRVHANDTEMIAVCNKCLAFLAARDGAYIGGAL